MKAFILSNKENIEALGWWLHDAFRHLTIFGLCLIVFSLVYLFGHAAGESAGASRTEAAFETCGRAQCWMQYSPSLEPAP